jgi:hypothetical protein
MMPPPQPYPGMYYQPMAPEHLLSHRNLFFANAAALVLVWIGLLIRLLNTGDATLLHGAWFFVVTGGLLGALASTAGALGSKKTTDLQNIGLFVWAGCLAILTGLALFAAGI